MLSTEILGWAGTLLILLAYFLLTHKNLSGNSAAYQLMNIFGAAFLGVSAYSSGVIPSFAINIIWVVIGLYGFASALKVHENSRRKRKPYKR